MMAGRLRTTTFDIEDVLPIHPIIVCSTQDKIMDVLRRMIEHNVIAVPVTIPDAAVPLNHHQHHWHGFIDMWDIARYVVQHFSKEKLGETERSFWEFINEELVFHDKTVHDLMQHPIRAVNVFHPITAGHSAFSVCEIMAQEKIGRFPIVRSHHDRHVIRFITQKQVARWLDSNLHLIGSKRSKPLNNCAGLFQTVICVKYEDIAMEAFEIMVENNISGVAVVNDTGQLVNHISIGDLKLIGTDASMFWRLQQTVLHFTRQLAVEYSRKHQRARHVVYSTTSATIEDVSHCLVTYGYHRLYVVDNHIDLKPVGVCSLSDLIHQIVIQ